MNRDEVKTAFRIGARTILADFGSSEFGSHRDSLFRSKTRLRGSGLFISESLTPRRRHILRSLLELKAAGKLYAVFTQSGDIFVRETGSSSPARVPDMPTVQRLAAAAASRRPVHGRTQASIVGVRASSTETTDTQADGLRSRPGSAAPGRSGSASATSTRDPPQPRRSGTAPSPIPSAVSIPPCSSDPGTPLPVVRGPLPDPRRDDPIESRRPAVLPSAGQASPGGLLAAPLRSAVMSEVTPAVIAPPISAAAALPDGGWFDAVSGPTASDPAPPASTTRGRPAAAAPARQKISCKLRVSVGSRSRVISVSNENDVLETITDLIKASKRKPGRYFKCVDKFWDEYGQCVRGVLTSAEGGGADAQKVAEAVTRVRASANKLYQELRCSLDSVEK